MRSNSEVISILKDEMNRQDISTSELSRRVNVAKSSISRYLNETRDFPLNKASDFAKALHISTEYLLGMETKTKPVGIKIPVLGEVAAGVPISAVEDILDYEEISEDMARTGEFFALQIKGDSMQPKFDNGDVVIVKQQSDVDSGDIAIVLVNGDSATCKKIQKHDNGIMLISTNPNYPPRFFSKDEVQELPVRILGKVVELRAKF